MSVHVNVCVYVRMYVHVSAAHALSSLVRALTASKRLLHVQSRTCRDRVVVCALLGYEIEYSIIVKILASSFLDIGPSSLLLDHFLLGKF